MPDAAFGARTRAGCPWLEMETVNGRLRTHGVVSTGPRTSEGMARKVAAKSALRGWETLRLPERDVTARHAPCQARHEIWDSRNDHISGLVVGVGRTAVGARLAALAERQAGNGSGRVVGLHRVAETLVWRPGRTTRSPHNDPIRGVVVGLGGRRPVCGVGRAGRAPVGCQRRRVVEPHDVPEASARCPGRTRPGRTTTGAHNDRGAQRPYTRPGTPRRRARRGRTQGVVR